MEENQFTSDYLEYYEYLVEKYRDNAKYENSYKVYKEVLELFKQCSTFDEFNTRYQEENFMIRTYAAQEADKARIRIDAYKQTEDEVRIAWQQRTLDAINNFEGNNIYELTQMLTKLSSEESNKIGIDTVYHSFHGEWLIMENIRIHEEAVVPDTYKQRMEDVRAENIETLKKSYQNEKIPLFNSMTDDSFKLEMKNVFKSYHRPMYPIKEESLKRLVNEYENYVELK